MDAWLAGVDVDDGIAGELTAGAVGDGGEEAGVGSAAGGASAWPPPTRRRAPASQASAWTETRATSARAELQRRRPPRAT
jgi:hypothetical protein